MLDDPLTLRPPAVTSRRARGALIALAAALALAASGAALLDAPEAHAQAGALDPTADPEAAAKVTSLPLEQQFRGSLIFWTHNVGASTFDKGQQLTYDPMYSQQLTLRPMWWPHPKVFLSAQMMLTHEFTENNFNTYADETVVNDLRLTVAAPGMVIIPEIGVGVNAAFRLIFPTSKLSQRDSMIMAISPTLGLSKRFDVLAGLFLSYTFGVTKFFHEYSTGGTETEGTNRCGITNGDIADLASSSCLNTGVRNTSVRMFNAFMVSLRPIPQLGITATVTTVHDFLYDTTGEVDATVDGPNTRYLMAYGLEIDGQVTPGVGVALGMSTVAPQLHSDPSKTYRQPFYDPVFTNFYFDVRLDLTTLVNRFLPKDEPPPAPPADEAPLIPDAPPADGDGAGEEATL